MGGSKNISIKEEVYNKLIKIKEEEESFSDLLDRLSEKEVKNTLEKFLGTISDKEAKEWLKNTKKARKEVKEREFTL